VSAHSERLPDVTITGAPSRVGLSPLRSVLPNGATIIAKQTRKTPAVTISLAIEAGSICDPAAAPGAMYLLSQLVDRGTTRRTGAEIAEALESRGNTLSVVVNRHLFSLTCTCLVEDFEALLPVLAEILMAPSVPDAELRIRRQDVVTALRQDEDNPYVRALEALLGLLYGQDHPYGRPVKGSVSGVERVTRDDLLALHAERFTPGALTAVLVGDVDPDHATSVASEAFGSWQRPIRPVTLPAAAPIAERREVVIRMANKAQADVAYGFVTIARRDPSYQACSLMNNILGQYAMGGRLGDSIRERQGMAYYCSSAFDAGLIEGPLVIRAGVAAKNVERVIHSIDDELTRLRQEGVTESELAESRQYLIGSMPRALETNAGIANFLQTCELFDLGLDYDVRLPGLLEGVTRDQVNEAARRLVDPARATVVVAGPVARQPGA
jgi:zinc protease